MPTTTRRRLRLANLGTALPVLIHITRRGMINAYSIVVHDYSIVMQ